MIFSFLIYLLYYNFLKKSIRKNWFFHQVEFNHNSYYIYLTGEFSRKPIARISRHFIDIFIYHFSYGKSEETQCSAISLVNDFVQQNLIANLSVAKATTYGLILSSQRPALIYHALCLASSSCRNRTYILRLIRN